MCNAEIKSLHDVSSTGNSENVCHVVITERGLCAHGLPAQIERAATEFTPKPRCVIVREKDLAVDAYEGLFHQVLTVTAQHQIPTMVHGQPDLAFRLVQQQIQLLAAESRGIDDQRRQLGGRRERLSTEKQNLATPDAHLLEAQRLPRRQYVEGG